MRSLVGFGISEFACYQKACFLIGVCFDFQHPEFSFLLKERVCPLIIKLFSPSIKHRVSSTPLEKPLYPVAVRLLRIVSVLIEKFYTLLVRFCFFFVSSGSTMLLYVLTCWQQIKTMGNSLMDIFQVTECEIFLSLLVKFLEPDKPQWQRALALEVLHTLTIQPALLR